MKKLTNTAFNSMLGQKQYGAAVEVLRKNSGHNF
jgi:hypothetical protein